MPDRATVERIAKFIARAAMNDNQPESEAAIKSAYARMQRDGVSFAAVLALPDDLLYQKGLIDLAAYIVAQQGNLSESAKRDLYARYINQVAARFSSGQNESPRYEEQREQTCSRGGDYERKNADTPKRKYSDTSSGFSFATVFNSHGLLSTLKNMFLIAAASFTRGGFIWHVLRSPGAAIRLFSAAALFGIALGLLALTVAASLHSLIGLGGPWIDMKFRSAWAFVGSALFLYKTVELYRRGWF